MKYLIDIYNKSYNKEGRHNAIAKPKSDVAKSLSGLVCIKRIVNYSCKTKIGKCMNQLHIALQLFAFFVFRKRGLVIIQYPYMAASLPMVCKFLKHLGFKIAVLVHDLESIRLNCLSKEEKCLYDIANVIIAHTPEMEAVVRQYGFQGTVEVLEFFDYYSNTQSECKVSVNNIDVVFAGNLQKSNFLNDLNAIIDRSVRFFLYGADNTELNLSDKVVYKGCFDAEDFSRVEGNWGLVWDGWSVDGCTGPYGEYLRYNSPFKMSLYLAMNIPLIVWTESAMARYVEKYHLGICVDSLSDIEKKIEELNDKEIELIRLGVDKASRDVRGGHKISAVVQRL